MKNIFLLLLFLIPIQSYSYAICHANDTEFSINDSKVRINLCETHVMKEHEDVIIYKVVGISVEVDGKRYPFADYQNHEFASHYICRKLKQFLHFNREFRRAKASYVKKDKVPEFLSKNELMDDFFVVSDDTYFSGAWDKARVPVLNADKKAQNQSTLIEKVSCEYY